MRLLGNVRYQIALILLLAIVPLAGLSVYLAFDEGRTDAQHARADAHDTVRLVSRDLNRVIQSSSDLVLGLSRYSKIRSSPESCDAELADLQPALPHFANMFVVGMDSTVLCAASNPMHVRTLRDRPENRLLIERVQRTGRIAVGGFVRTYPGKRVLPVGGPVLDEKGQLQSVFFATIDLDWLDQQINRVRLPEQAVLVVMDGQGLEIARNPRSPDWPAGTPAPDLERTLVGSTDFDREIKGYDGISRFYSVARVRPDDDLLVVMKVRLTEIYGPARRRLALHLGGLGLVGLLVMGLTWFGSDTYFRKPLSRLIEISNRLASGNLTARSGLSHRGEIGSLAQSFDQMAEALERNETAGKDAASLEAARLRRLRKLADLSMMLAGDPSAVFEQIVRMIGDLFEVRGVCLSEITGTDLRFRAIYVQGSIITDAGTCPMEITPCATVVASRDIKVFEHVMELFPRAEFLRRHDAYLWCGFPSLDNAGNVVAVTCLVDDKPREFTEDERQILWVIGQRIATEFERIKSMAAHARMEETLRENERRLEEAQHIARIGSFAGDGVSMQMEWSDEMYRIFEVDPSAGAPGMDIVMARAHPDDRPLIERTHRKLLAENSACEVEHRLLMPDGRVKHVLVKATGSPREGLPYMRGTVQDITERKQAEQEKARLQAQLNQSQKMESIGRLAGGISHDFNNLLTVINGYSDVLLHQLDSPVRKYAERIRKAGESAATLTRQLLAFSRMEAANPRPVLLNEVVAESRDMLERLVGEHIEMRTRLDAHPDEVLADPGQIQQCLLNLVVNARDAMPGGGFLSIETSLVHVDRRDFPLGTDAAPGPFVLLRVRDSGVGMDEETIQQIFEPFFTTKEKGRGTGLGLSTVYGIVTRSSGFIRVISQPAKGAEFTIYLPLHAAGLNAGEPGAAAHDTARGISGTMLVVEDQDIVREFVVESLRMSGHTVLEARSGSEALQLIAENRDTVQLLVSDVMMPGMRGEELAALAKDLCPSVRVLFMTGYADGAIASRPDTYDDVILKPFAPEELDAKVQTLLRQVLIQRVK